MKSLSALSLAILITVTAHAEMRTWTDIRGRKIQAEMVESRNGNIVLMTEDGKEVRIKISGLSSDDQKYVLVNTPPKIDIQISEATDRKNQGFVIEDAGDSSNDQDMQIQTQATEYKITLKRTGTIPYNKPMYAEFYLIGFDKEERAYVLLDKTVTRIDFDQEGSKGKYTFSSDRVTVQNLQGGREKGMSLYGHLVVLVDDQNRVFNTKGSRSKIVEHAAKIRTRDEGYSVHETEVESADNRMK